MYPKIEWPVFGDNPNGRKWIILSICHARQTTFTTVGKTHKYTKLHRLYQESQEAGCGDK